MDIKNFQTSQANCVRLGWKEAIEQALAEHSHERLDNEWLDSPLSLVSDDEFEW